MGGLTQIVGVSYTRIVGGLTRIVGVSYTNSGCVLHTNSGWSYTNSGCVLHTNSGWSYPSSGCVLYFIYLHHHQVLMILIQPTCFVQQNELLQRLHDSSMSICHKIV